MPRTLQDWIDKDKETFAGRSASIREALVDLKTGMLKSVSEDNKEDVFYMLCFCLLVSQSKQYHAEEVIDILKKQDYYHKSIDMKILKDILSRKVRFHNHKATRTEEARQKFLADDFWKTLKKRSEEYHSTSGRNRRKILLHTRDWLIREIKGFSSKLSSHFLRNVGMRGLAILDVHVLRALEERELIVDYLPLTKDRYYDIEKKMEQYAELVGISLDELDQLFWSNATGYVGK